MKILNNYCGLGGNRKLWGGVSVTAVELEPDIAAVYQKENPKDKVIISDAHQYLIDNYREFDFIWGSPPCPSHSAMAKATRHTKRSYPDMTLYQEIIFLQHFFKGLWVIENVKPYYEPLIPPIAIIGRHYFWANFQIKPFKTENIKGFITNGTVADSEKLKKWLGIEYEGNIYYKNNHCPSQVLRNCVNPDLGLYILEQAQWIIRQEKITQTSLFS